MSQPNSGRLTLPPYQNLKRLGKSLVSKKCKEDLTNLTDPCKMADTWDGDVAYKVAKMIDNYLEIVITSSPKH